MESPHRGTRQQPRDRAGTLNVPTLAELADAMRPQAVPADKRTNWTVKEWADHWNVCKRHANDVLTAMVKKGVMTKGDPVPVPIGNYTRWVPSYELTASKRQGR